ncbi:hypothetical protein HUG10_20475 (plasmid) [Halorarum halophilum]|uniref:Agglutinin C-terminal domain-containing protein n=1 Tax=Halorarum halophilum TaxID=2743090 RepID=A0A7D5GEQ3_9EURY|nr:hypothetical protein [Halobaculum halophilum]QLG29985.1 hypothetical protein HUG10_20475 [Halobaculum halophilum]
MSDEQRWEPHVERRDTSWVQGELARDFPHFPRGGLSRVSLDSRYYLTTPDDFSKIVEETVIGHRYFRRSKFDCENFAVAFQSIVAQRYGVNSVGVVVNHAGTRAFNVVMYEDGTTELFDPDTEHLVVTGDTRADTKAYSLSQGLIIL